MSSNPYQILDSDAAKKLQAMNALLQETSRNVNLQSNPLLNTPGKPNSSASASVQNTSNKVEDKDIKENIQLNNVQLNAASSHSTETKKNADSQPKNTAALERKVRVETIADLPEEIQKFLLDDENRNTIPWYVDANHPTFNYLYQFALTDSVNDRSHGFTPLMILLLFGRSDLASKMLDYEGIDLKLASENTDYDTFENFTALSMLLMHLGFRYGSGNLQYEFRNNTEAQDARDLELVKRIITLCPALVHHQIQRSLDSGYTELSLIAATEQSQKSIQCLQIYHNHQANMDIKNDNGSTPLYNMATQVNYNTMFHPERLNTLLFLLNCRADVNVVPQIPVELLNSGDPHCSDDGNTVAHACAYYGLNAETVAMCLSAGYKYNLNNKHKMTFGEIARTNPTLYPDHIRHNLVFFADQRFEIPEDTTAEAVIAQNRATLAEVFHIVDIFYHSLKMQTPSLSTHSSQGLQKSVHELSKHETSDKKCIAEFNCIEFVKRYINMGLPLGLRDAQGRSPLHMACMSVHTDSKEMVKLLLSTAANIATPRSKQDSADVKTNAEQAQCHNNERLFAMLTAVDDNNRTPLDLASISKSPARFVLMNVIQQMIDRLILQWRLNANDLINNLSDKNFPNDQRHHVMQYSAWMHLFAHSVPGISLMQLGFQKSMRSIQIKECAKRKAEARCASARQNGRAEAANLIDPTLTMYTQYTQNVGVNNAASDVALSKKIHQQI